MTILIVALGAGFLVGLVMRGKSRLLRRVHFAATSAIFSLLFLLGLSVGANEQILSNLYHLGADALALSISGTAGSVLLVALLYRGYSR